MNQTWPSIANGPASVPGKRKSMKEVMNEDAAREKRKSLLGDSEETAGGDKRESRFGPVVKRASLTSYQTSFARNDVEAVFKAVAADGLQLEWAANALKSDHELVLVAVKQNGIALKFATAELKADREIALQAVSKCGLALEFCAPILQDDRKLVEIAVHQNPHALRFASDTLKENREVVLAAIDRNGCALEHAGPLLKADQYVVLQSVLQLQRASRPRTTVELYLQRCIEFEAYTTQNIASPIHRFRAVVRSVMRFNRMVNAKLMQLIDGIDDGAEDVVGGGRYALLDMVTLARARDFKNRVSNLLEHARLGLAHLDVQLLGDELRHAVARDLFKPRKSELNSALVEVLERGMDARLDGDLQMVYDSMKTLRIFAAYESDEAKLLCKAVRYRTLMAGEVLYYEGDPGGSLFIVLHGALLPIIDCASAKPLMLTPIGPGQSVGKVSFLNHTALRSATIVATTFTELLYFEAEPYMRVMETLKSASGLQGQADAVEVLRKVRLFSKLRPIELERIADVLVPKRFCRGDVIVEEGSEALNGFVIKRGTCKVVKTLLEDKALFEKESNMPQKVEARRVEVAELGPHEYFGEDCLLEMQKPKQFRKGDRVIHATRGTGRVVLVNFGDEKARPNHKWQRCIRAAAHAVSVPLPCDC